MKSLISIPLAAVVVCGGGLYVADPFDIRAQLSEAQVESIEQAIAERYDIADVQPVVRDNGMSLFRESDRKAWDRIVLADPSAEGPGDTVPQGVWVTLPGEKGQRRHLYVLGGDPLAGEPALRQAPEVVIFSRGVDRPPVGQAVDEPDPESFERDGGASSSSDPSPIR